MCYVPHSAHRIKVCVIDSGVQYNHPDLQDNMPSQVVRDVVQDIYAGPDNDGRGHGTHCAGACMTCSQAAPAWRFYFTKLKFLDCPVCTYVC